MTAKAALIQFDWDLGQVAGVQVIEQTTPDEDVIATAHDIKAAVQAEHPHSRFAVVANDDAERQRPSRLRVATLPPPVVVLDDPWATARMAD